MRGPVIESTLSLLVLEILVAVLGDDFLHPGGGRYSEIGADDGMCDLVSKDAIGDGIDGHGDVLGAVEVEGDRCGTRYTLSLVISCCDLCLSSG